MLSAQVAMPVSMSTGQCAMRHLVWASLQPLLHVSVNVIIPKMYLLSALLSGNTESVAHTQWDRQWDRQWESSEEHACQRSH